MLVRKNILTKYEIKSKGFKYKEAGVCTLIAIAMTNSQKYTIITEDQGKVYAHPNQNLFDTYAISHDIKV